MSLETLLDHPLCISVYGLNKSFTKKISIGLESKSLTEFRPVVRISGKDFDGIKFVIDDWKLLVTKLDTLESWFYGGSSEKNKKKHFIECGAVTISMVKIYDTDSILFEEQPELKDDDEPTSKRYRKTIMIQKNTFLNLVGVVPIINSRLEKLVLEAPAVFATIKELDAAVLDLQQSFEESQIQIISPHQVRFCASTILTKKSVESLKEIHSRIISKIPDCTLSVTDIKNIYFEMLGVNINFLVNDINNILLE